MMHISLDQFNLMLHQNLDDQERARLTDHILVCDQCAHQFRLLNELHQHMQPQSPSIKRRAATVVSMPIVRYGLGVAAVMVMALTPYLSDGAEPNNLSAGAAVRAEMASSEDQRQAFSILDEVREANYRAALKNWGQETNMIDLVATKSNR